MMLFRTISVFIVLTVLASALLPLSDPPQSAAFLWLYAGGLLAALSHMLVWIFSPYPPNQSLAVLHVPRRFPVWMNLGFWELPGAVTKTNTYTAACEAFARKIANAAHLAAADRVLDVGFGWGEQCVWFANDVLPPKATIVGLNPSREQVSYARRLVRQCNLEHRIHLDVGSATALTLSPPVLDVIARGQLFDAVVAVDCAYHFRPAKAEFFAQALHVLRPGGSLAFSDLIRVHHELHTTGVSVSYCMYDYVRQCVMSLLCWLCDIPLSNMLCDSSQLRTQLQTLGFTDVSIEDSTREVLGGFANVVCDHYTATRWLTPARAWLKFRVAGWMCRFASRSQRVAYVFVSASKPLSQ